MDIKEIRQARQQLEQDLLELFKRFEETTGVEIEDVDLDRSSPFFGPPRTIYRVSVEIELS